MNWPHPKRHVVAAASVALAAWTGCAEQEPPPELPPRAIMWERVSGAAAGEQRVISGIVTAVSDTKLAFEVGGIVETVEVNLGDRVEGERVLARLDPEPFELTVSDAEAGLAEARAKRESANADYERTKELFDADVASRQELDRDRARRESRTSQVDAAEARLNLAKRDLRRSVLRAPFSGSISVREIDPAMKVASGQVVIEMDSGESGMRVEVRMPETLVARVHQGDEVQVGFPSVGRGAAAVDPITYPAVVTEVGTRASTGNAFPVRADLRDTPADLRPGMTAEVTFEFARQQGSILNVEGLLVPIAAALIEGDDQVSVFVYDSATSTVNKRMIQTGGVRDNEIAVLEGLEPGEIIATAGVTFLREGQKVTLLDEELVQHAP